MSAQLCAAMVAGKHCKVEYTTHRDEDGPYVVIHAVLAGDWRIPASYFREDAIKDFEAEARAVEMSAHTDEWGLPDETSAAPVRIKPRKVAA